MLPLSLLMEKLLFTLVQWQVGFPETLKQSIDSQVIFPYSLFSHIFTQTHFTQKLHTNISCHIHTCTRRHTYCQPWYLHYRPITLYFENYPNGYIQQDFVIMYLCMWKEWYVKLCKDIFLILKMMKIDTPFPMIKNSSLKRTIPEGSRSPCLVPLIHIK